MVRILLYGGCHALVLRDMLEALYSRSEVETSLLINFQLIASGEPFPYDTLDRLDAVVFSPIENKGAYNTDRLLDECRARGTLAICFPWMEWHGYCPGAVKGVFKGRFQWFYPGLIELAAQFDDFDEFVEHATVGFPANEIIDQTLARTNAYLSAAEDRHAMPVRISDFIRENHRSSRLFLVSDHPALALYRHVLKQIVRLVGVTWRAESLVEFPPREPQWRWRIPIFPRVAERLGLAFQDTDWRDDELVPGKAWPIETYLSLYFHRESVILGPLRDTGLHFVADTIGHEPPFGLGTRIFAKPLAANETDLAAYAYLATLSGRDIDLDRNAAFRIDSSQWRSTWDF